MKKGIIIIILFGVILSCKRENDSSKFGPEIIISSADFTVNGFSVNPSYSVNLANEDTYFTCTLPQRAEFKFVITGLVSGAVKTISNAGDYIDLSNSSWTGDSDNLNIFRAGEECSIELSFRGAIKKYYDTISVATANVYPALLINDFEGISFDKNGPQAQTVGTYLDDFAQSDIRIDDTLQTCQGTQSVLFDGHDANNSFYIGGMYLQPAVAMPFVFDTYAPDSLYFNAYVYSYGDNTTKLIFVINEDDNNDNVADEAWVKELPLGEKGWSLVSYRFKDFIDEKPAVGNGVRNFNRVISLNVNLSGRTAGVKARANVDYITVTYGRPFEP
jgi:hypothetical protein